MVNQEDRLETLDGSKDRMVNSKLSTPKKKVIFFFTVVSCAKVQLNSDKRSALTLTKVDERQFVGPIQQPTLSMLLYSTFSAHTPCSKALKLTLTYSDSISVMLHLLVMNCFEISKQWQMKARWERHRYPQTSCRWKRLGTLVQ